MVSFFSIAPHKLDMESKFVQIERDFSNQLIEFYAFEEEKNVFALRAVGSRWSPVIFRNIGKFY